MAEYAHADALVETDWLADHLDGLDEREMASVLDVAPGTVKSRLHRARLAFRARWSA